MEDELDKVKEVLQQSKRSNLEAEVIITAFLMIKENPDIEINTALTFALAEWDS